ncbi:GNAT family N-acetyltransferase [Canibacter sp. lx-72]|nr:GNAT family protein [Canibacter zhuwentaonis]MBT1018776.1 GNAT family N-acetyltransferase [Canibacter zhuwentaonis]
MQIKVYPENIGSIRVAEKAGFTPESTIHETELQRGTVRDLVVYSAKRAN